MSRWDDELKVSSEFNGELVRNDEEDGEGSKQRDSKEGDGGVWKWREGRAEMVVIVEEGELKLGSDDSGERGGQLRGAGT